jgi:hypothetical protein
MKTFLTGFKAIDPKTNQLCSWSGPNIETLTIGMAQQWCDENAGHLVVIGELICSIPCRQNGLPDFENILNHDVENN